MEIQKNQVKSRHKSFTKNSRAWLNLGLPRDHFGVTCSLLLAECPGFIHIKVCVPSHPRTREEGVSQRPPFTIKERHVSMVPGGKEQHDIRPFAAIFYIMVKDLLKMQGRHLLPNAEGPPDGLVGLLLANSRGVVLNAERKEKINPRV